MSYTYLSNTVLASFALDKNNIFTYAQAANGEIVEIQGNLNGSGETYAVTGDNIGIGLTRLNGSAPAKRFTPIAATRYYNKVQFQAFPFILLDNWMLICHIQRYVFYLDDNNYLRDAYYEDGSWKKGVLYDQEWRAAHYSKLAAITLTNQYQYDFICLYYQDNSTTGDIKLVNLSPTGWNAGNPDLDDPPLFGTSLAVVPPEPGIEVVSTDDNRDPVLFFQYNKLELGSSQDQGPNDYATYDIQDKNKALSSQASISAVDDGHNFWCFYTSDDNNVQWIRIDKNGGLKQPQPVALDMTPIPASPVSAVFVQGSNYGKIILFYLLHYDESGSRTAQEINIYASTLTSTTYTPQDNWSVSKRVCLSE
ncbi:hypothetical protein B0T17DRAFT_606598 [Bombardia bombarda]|uniref:Fucose-specific lectin n=1 Tax=Bombardia bombarda TaxID=252184 RepID=A0AA39X8E8_9PEZI|nr:hypothetical protein B0T17DRAFT_606598 [Bombardia bombarda]